MLFFVSVGMLFNPDILLEHPFLVLATVFIIVVGKSAAAFLIVLAFRKPLTTALTISASLSQIGEFSFILAALGVELGLLPEQGRDLILAGAIISIVLNPLVFYACDRIRRHIEGKAHSHHEEAVPSSETAAQEQPTPTAPKVVVADDDAELKPTALTDHVVVVGYGRVGSIVVDKLVEAGTPFLVIEDTDKRVAELHERHVEVIPGNAASAEVLGFANLGQARGLIVAIPNAFEACSVVEQGRRLNPPILIVARAHSDAEVAELTRYGADTVIMGEREIALGMVDRLAQVHHDKAPYEDAPGAGITATTQIHAEP